MKRIWMLLMCLVLGIGCAAASAETAAAALPEKTTAVGAEAFMNDLSLEELALPEGILSIGDRAFAGSGLRDIILPLSLEEIGQDAFRDCKNLTIHVYRNSYAQEYCEQSGLPYELITGPQIPVGIIHLDPAESGYREKNVADLYGTFTDENGYAPVFVKAGMPDEQKQAALDLISEGVRYLLICAADPDGWEEILTDARDAGIRVILFDRMINCDPSLYAAAVVSSMRRQGEQAVAYLESLQLGEYKILHIQGMKGSDAQAGRSGPLEEKVKANSNWTLAGQDSAYWDSDNAYSIAQEQVKNGPAFNVLYAENDGMAQGAVRALDEAGITHGLGGQVAVVSFDCNKWALRELLAGNWNYDGQSSPFQAETMDRLIRTLEAGEEIQGLNEKNQYILEEKGFTAGTITEADVQKYGLGEEEGGDIPSGSRDLVGISMPTKEFDRWQNDGYTIQDVLEAVGLETMLAFAGNDVSTQVADLEEMIESGCRVLIVAPIYGPDLNSVMTKAMEAGISVIAYDRSLGDFGGEYYYVTFDNYLVGQVQGQFVRDALKLESGSGAGPYNIEFTAGDPGDTNAKLFYSGAMDVLKPYIDSRKLRVLSGQTAFDKVATNYWSTENAQKRADEILTGYYADGAELAAWVCSNDSTALGVIRALDGYQGPWPVITGQDCDMENVRMILAGKQAMSVLKDSKDLADQAVNIATRLMWGEHVEVNDTETYSSSLTQVLAYAVTPGCVTAANYREKLIETGIYSEEDLQ